MGAWCGQPVRAVEQSCASLVFHLQAFVRVHKAVLILFGFLYIFRLPFPRNKSGSFGHCCLDKQMWLVDLLCVSFLDLKIIWLKPALRYRCFSTAVGSQPSQSSEWTLLKTELNISATAAIQITDGTQSPC